MFAKLVDNQLQIAGNVITGHDETGYYSITNPTEEQLRQKGYKLLIVLPTPQYDIENEKLVEKYIETATDITVDYNIITLTDEEHNIIIQKEIEVEENKMTQRYVRNASLGDSFALGKLQEIENNIVILRAKLRGGN